MAGEMEDAVTFLDRISVDYPDVLSLLDSSQLLALDMDPRKPFETHNVRNLPCVCERHKLV